MPTHYVSSIAVFGASQVALVVKKLPSNAGDLRDVGSTPRWGRSPGGGHGNPLQYSCLENLMDKGAWQAIVHRVAKRWTQLKRLSERACTHAHTHTQSCLHMEMAEINSHNGDSVVHKA